MRHDNTTWKKNGSFKYEPSCCSTLTILRRYPTTDQHRGFDMLRFRPGSVHPSLDNLVISSSPRNTILILNLVWTPDQHGSGQTRTPGLK
ncbi:hypothetical protein XELAEV_18038727mg [Xenopus laevis]|uniref:Uncharacterized protein n=1 Tax=Xenopus laevis TaxID=8355 RepID=A0A974C7C8_XENLA|nr:hypothetical protein XELAEV_18038727mg [Xenopus laevis]